MNTILASLFILCVSTCVNAKETVHWAKYDFKPFFVLNGADFNTGIGDLVYNMLQNNLPQYHHKNYTSTMPRILRDLEGTKLICTGLLRRPSKDNTVLYSLPVIQIPSISIQFHKSQLQRIEQLTNRSFNNPVSIESLLQSNLDIKIGITHQRSYGEKIDTLIKKYPKKFISSDRQNRIKEHINLTHKNRTTITLEYPVVSFSTFKDTDPFIYHSTPISDIKNNLLGKIACPNTSSGQKFISNVNTQIKRRWLNENYKSIVGRWLPLESLTHYRKHYADIEDVFK